MDIVSPHRDPDERQSPDDEVIDTKIGQLTTAHILCAELKGSKIVPIYLIALNTYPAYQDSANKKEDSEDASNDEIPGYQRLTMTT